MSTPPEVEPVARWHLVLFALLLTATAALSVLSLELVYPHLSWNRDEPVYLWHVAVLEDGRLFGDLGRPVEGFRPWLAGVDDEGYFSQYTLGWPLVLLGASRVVGTVAGAVVLGAVLHVAGAVAVAREVLGRNRLALAVGAATAVSPAVVIQAGVHLSYLFTAGLGTLSLAAIWAASRRGVRWPLALAGVLLGWVLLTRPFDAVVWGTAAVVGLAIRARGDVRQRLRSLAPLWVTVLAGVPFAAFTIVYNLRITGEALTFPIVATDPLDTYGFGTRRLMPTFDTVDYDLGKAAFASAKNGFFFVVFLTGNAVTAGLALFATWTRRRLASTWMLVAMAAAFPVGYFAFWGMHVSSLTARLVGSIYYMPAIVPVLALAALGAAEVGRRSRPLAVGLVVAAGLLTLPVLGSRLAVNQRISEAQGAWSASLADLEAGDAETGDGPALVIVAESGPYVMFKNPEARNAPALDGAVLYANDLGAGNLATIRAHPDRTPYLQVATADADELGPREESVEFTVDIVPMSLLQGTTLRLEARFVPLDGAPVVIPFTEVGGVTTWGDPADIQVGADGASTVVVEFDAADLGSGDGVVVRVGFGAGDSPTEAEADPRVRWEVVAAAEGDGVAALVPAQQFRRFAVGPDFYWYPRPADPSVDLQVSTEP